MTEYETASLAMQQSLLDMMLLQIIVGALVAGLVGMAQVGSVLWGIRSMVREGKKRDDQHQQRHAEVMAGIAAERKASEDRHAKDMARIAAEGKESDKRHAEVMAQHEAAKERHAEVMAGIAAERKASEERHAKVMAGIAAEGKESDKRRAASKEQHAKDMAAIAAERAESKERHVEAMKALDALIERTGKDSRPPAAAPAPAPRSSKG